MYNYQALASDLMSFGMLVVVAAVPTWGWVRWMRQPHESGAWPNIAAGALAVTSVSCLLAFTFFVRSFFVDVMLYNDPVGKQIAGAGFLSAFFGLLISLLAVWRPSRVRWHALASSIILMILWFGVGMSI